jgi:hypothetical protein
MIRNIPKPKISSKFSIDDIHKIRQWTSKKLENATVQEQMDYYNSVVSKYKKSKIILK